MSDNALEDFTQWAKEHGIKICGVKAHEIPSHGIGIVATRDLREGERVLFIPRSAMVTPASKGAKQLRLPEASSGQTRIAAYLTLSSQCEEFGFRDWQRTWPSIEALQASIPFFWPVELQSLLPPSAVALLKHQSLLISESWRQVKHLVPKASKSRFLYYYFIINSRTMYWRDTDSGNHRSTSAANNLALCPFLDFLNHSPSCQPATRTDQGYEIRTERPYVAGEEIFVSYGAHGNDFLLVEYGFLPEPGTNVWDSLSIDHFIIPALSTGQNDTLARYGFLGDYTLFLGTPATEQPEPCFRTLVALFLIERGVCAEWIRFKDGIEDNRAFKPLPQQVATAVAREQEASEILLKSLLKLTLPQHLRLADPVRRRLSFLVAKYQRLLERGVLAPWACQAGDENI